MQSGRRLYVGRLSQDATRPEVEAYFGTHGKIVDVRLMAGFCFLEYEELKDAEDAVADFSGKEFMGERLIVEFAKPPRNVDPDRAPRRFDDRGMGGGYGDRGGYQPRGDGGRGYNDQGPPRSFVPRSGGGHRLQVTGIPEGSSWQDLKDFARSAGTVTFADVDRNNPNVGFIEYPSRSDADDAIRTLSNTEFKGALVTVDEAPKQDPSEDRRPADNGYSSRGGGGGDYHDRRPAPRDYDRRDDRRGDDRRGGDRRDDYRSRDDREYRSRDDRDYRSRDEGRERRRSVSPAPRERRERSPVQDRERSER